MKKYIAILMILSLLMAFAFSGCKNKSVTEDKAHELTKITSVKTESEKNEGSTAKSPEKESTQENIKETINETTQKNTSKTTSKTSTTTTKKASSSTTKKTTTTTKKVTTTITTKTITTTTKATTAATTKPVQNGIMSRFSATDIYGNSYNQSILSNKKITVVNLWATWCSPCRSELPTLEKMSKDYASKGVQILGVLWIDGSSIVSDAQYIATSAGLDYINLVNQGDMVSIIKTANGGSSTYSLPMTFCVDSNGCQIGDTIYGAMNESGWNYYINYWLSLV